MMRENIRHVDGFRARQVLDELGKLLADGYAIDTDDELDLIAYRAVSREKLHLNYCTSENKMIKRCLDCGAHFTSTVRDPFRSFECSECGAMHVLFRGKWMLEDDAIDAGMEREVR